MVFVKVGGEVSGDSGRGEDEVEGVVDGFDGCRGRGCRYEGGKGCVSWVDLDRLATSCADVCEESAGDFLEVRVCANSSVGE